MTQEDKELLLKDLCARLPYGVIVRHADYLIDSDGNHTGQFWYKRGYLYDICRLDNMTTTIIESEGSDEEGYEHICDLERSLPYLRPMSSMTEEEKRDLSSKYNWNIKGNDISIRYHSEGYWDDDTECPTNEYLKLFDWLNAHHFDYRGLIDLGLALVAPEGMYN